MCIHLGFKQMSRKIGALEGKLIRLFVFLELMLLFMVCTILA